MRSLTYSFEVPDDVDTVEEALGEGKHTILAEGFERGNAAVLLLSAAEGMIRAQVERELRESDPLEAHDTVVAMAFLNARLQVIDVLMHLEPRPLDATFSEM